MPSTITHESGACPTCGASFREYEFVVDRIGHVHVEHTCDPARLAAFAYAPDVFEFICDGCGEAYTAVQERLRCDACSQVEKQRQARARWLRRRVA